MAITGKFEADFSSFTAAVAAAEVSLKGFESDGGKVEARLTSLGNALSGVRIIQQATLAADAVTRLGGAGGTAAGLLKLTETELARVGASAIEAQAKFAALGQTAPAAIQQVAKAATDLADKQKESGGMLGDIGTELAGMISGYLTAGAAIEVFKKAFDFSKEALADAAALEDLSLATGITTDGLQRLTYVASEFGVNQETMARGVETLSSRLAGGNKSATAAVEALGLSVKDLIASGPEEAFLSVADAVGQVSDPMTAAALRADIFGEKLSKTLGPALRDLRTRMNDVPKDAIISDATIKSAHDFEVAIEHLETRTKAFVADALGPLATGLMFITGNMDLWTAGINAGSAAYDKSIAKQKTATEGLGALTAGWGHMAAASTDAGEKGKSNADILAAHLQALKTQGMDPLSESNKRYLDVAIQANESMADSAHWLGVSEAAVKKYEDAQKAAAEAAKKHQEALEALTAAQHPLTLAQQERASSLLAMKLTEQQIAEIMGVNVVQIRAYAQAVKDAAAAQTEANKIAAMWAKTTDELGKQSRELADYFEARRAKEADAIAHQQTATLAIMTDFHNRVNEMGLRGTALRLAQIDRQQAATQAELDKEADKTTWYFKQAQADADKYYQHLRDLANHTYDTLHERMEAQGIYTKTALAAQAADLETDYNQMREDGDYTAAEISAAWQRMCLANVAAEDGWAAHAEAIYKELNQAFTQVAQTATATGHAAAGAALTSLSGLTSNLAAAQKANNQWGGSAGIASALFSDQASATDKWAAGIQSGVQVASGAMEVWSATANAGGKAASAFAGGMAGAKAGAAFGPWGAAVGAAAGAIVGLVRGATAGRRAVEDFASTLGGFDALHAKLDALPTGQGEELWKELTQGTNKGDPKQAQANIDKVTAALKAGDEATAKFDTDAGGLFAQIQSFGGNIDSAMLPYLNDLAKAGKLSADNVALLGKMSGDGKPTYQQLDTLAKKYNLTLDQMGAGFQGAKIHDEFQSLVDDMDELQRGGVDLGAVLTTTGADGKLALSDLGKSVSDVIDQSIKYGQDIPENMKPAAQALIDQGLLLDDNGNKITDINQLKFGESMQTSLDTLNKTLKDLIDSLHTLSGTTATPTIAPRYVPPDTGGAGGGGAAAPAPAPAAWGGAQAEGGDYYVSKPTMFLAGEAGPEAVSFGGGNGRRGGGMSLKDTHITLVLQDGRQLAEVVVPHIPIVVREYGLNK